MDDRAVTRGPMRGGRNRQIATARMNMHGVAGMAGIRIKSGERGTTPIYVVDAGVGRNQPNQRADVLLIQFILRVLAGKRVGKTGELFQVPGAAPLSIDGSFGTQTAAAISRYQKLENAIDDTGSYKTRTDGIVDTLGSGLSVPGNFPTLLLLNWTYQSQLGDNEHAHLYIHPLFPRELMPKLYY